MTDAPAKLIGGSLERTPAAVLFRSLYVDRTTAQLLMSRRGEERTFWWERGEVVWAASSREAQLVGETLRTFGLADESVLFSADERALAEPGRGLAKALAETGAVAPFVADACVRALAERIFFDTLSWSDGSFTLTPAGDASAPPLRFDRTNANLLIEGLRRLPKDSGVPGIRIEPRARAVLSSSLLLRYQLVGLLPEEADVLSALDPQKSIGELAPDLAILARLVAIGLVEMISPGKTLPPRVTPEKLGLLNAELAGAAPSSRTAELGEQQAVLVKNTYRRVDWVNLYEILGVSKESSLEELQQAVHDRARSFHPDLAHRSHLLEMREALETLFSRVLAAERSFKSEDSRKAYDKSILGGGQVIAVESTEPTRLVQDQIAKANYTRSRTLFEMGDFYPAYEMMKQAVEFDPDKWEYWVLLSRIQRKNPKWIRQSAETMRRAAERIPGNAEVFFELAEAFRAARNETERVVALKEVLKIDPANRRAQSALAEIASMKPSR
jgi:curved DNA-binding protein CbpA